VVDALFAGVAAATAGSVLPADLTGAVVERVGAGFCCAKGSEFTNRLRSFCALRATSQPDSSNNPTPRVCLNRLFLITASSAFPGDVRLHE
jgi:hypothetical protein